MGVRRGAVLLLLAQWGRYGLQLVSLVLLARLLAPRDFGLVAMATAVTGFAAVVGDFGLSLAALQAERLSPAQRSALFWLNTALGTAVGLLVALASPLVALLYRDPRLMPVVVVLGAVFVLNGIAVQFSVDLNRAHRFGALGGTEFAAQAAGVAAAGVLAVLGAGYWALVAQQIVTAFVLLLLLVLLVRWRPALPRRGGDARALLRFGRDTFAVQIVNYLTSNLDSVLIGRTFGAVLLGLYNRAFLIAMLPVQQLAAPLTRVFLPALSRAGETDFVPLLARLQRLTAYALLTPLSLASALAVPALTLVLGPRWAGAAVLLQVLAVGAGFQSVGFVYYWAFLAKRRTSDLFRSELPGRLAMVVLMFLLVGRGAVSVAAVVALGQALIWLAAVVRYGPRAGIPSLVLLKAMARPAGIGVAAGAVGAAAVATSASAPTAVQLLAGLGAWGLVVAVAVALIPGVRTDVRGMSGRVRARRSATA